MTKNYDLEPLIKLSKENNSEIEVTFKVEEVVIKIIVTPYD